MLHLELRGVQLLRSHAVFATVAGAFRYLRIQPMGHRVCAYLAALSARRVRRESPRSCELRAAPELAWLPLSETRLKRRIVLGAQIVAALAVSKGRPLAPRPHRPHSRSS